MFVLPALVWNAHYVLVFKLWMTALRRRLHLRAPPGSCAGSGSSPLRLAPVVLAPVLLGPVFLNRYDPLPALLTSLALVALLRSRERTTGALLGVATAMKIYSGGRRCRVAARRVRSIRGGGAVAFVVAAAVLDAAVLRCSHPAGSATASGPSSKRHLQIESLGASILLAGSKLGVHHVDWIRGQAGIDRPRRPPARRRRRALVACSPSRSCCSSRAPTGAGRDDDRAARHGVGGGGRRVHGLRQGALAAVPDLARPARPARGRPQGALRGRHAPRARWRSPSPSTSLRPVRPAQPGLDASGCCSLRNALLVATLRALLYARAAARGARLSEPRQYDCPRDDLGRDRRRRLPRLASLRLPARAGPPRDLRRQPRDGLAREHRAPARRRVRVREPGRRRRDLDRRAGRLRLPPREPGEPDRLPPPAAADAEGRLAGHAQRARPREVEARALPDQLDERGLRRPAGASAAGDVLGQRQPDRPARRVRRGEALRRGADDGLPQPAGRQHRDRAHLQHLRPEDAPQRRPRDR